MLGWQIFVHALRMVFGNIKQVLQITVGPALISLGLMIAWALLARGSSEPIYYGAGGRPTDVADGTTALGLLALIAVCIMFIWVAVAWHRYVLLEEYPSGFLPTINTDRMLAYFSRAFMVGLLIVALALPILVVYLGLGRGLPLLAILFLIAGYVFVATVTMRLSITLPAAAIGEVVTFKEAWQTTRGASGAIVVVVLASFVFQFLVQLGLEIFALVPIVGGLLDILVWTIMIPVLNLSILTTVFGVYVQRRQLA